VRWLQARLGHFDKLVPPLTEVSDGQAVFAGQHMILKNLPLDTLREQRQFCIRDGDGPWLFA
jgi:hypothetical protein